jgi:hypothetical protein
MQEAFHGNRFNNYGSLGGALHCGHEQPLGFFGLAGAKALLLACACVFDIPKPRWRGGTLGIDSSYSRSCN